MNAFAIKFKVVRFVESLLHSFINIYLYAVYWKHIQLSRPTVIQIILFEDPT